jgi:hypothetical protein
MPYKDPKKRREAARIRMQNFRERHKDDLKYKEDKKKWNKITWSRHGKRYGEKYKQWYAENREERLLKMKNVVISLFKCLCVMVCMSAALPAALATMKLIAYINVGK